VTSVGVSLFNYQDDARSNKDKIIFIFAPKTGNFILHAFAKTEKIPTFPDMKH